MSALIDFGMAALCWLLITASDWLLDMNDYPQG